MRGDYDLTVKTQGSFEVSIHAPRMRGDRYFLK